MALGGGVERGFGGLGGIGLELGLGGVGGLIKTKNNRVSGKGRLVR